MKTRRLCLNFSTASNYKYRFVQGFLRSLKRINRRKPTSNVSSPREICRRFLEVKSAADASMASAVGSRRAWSRALLQKTRSQDRSFGNNKLDAVRRRISTKLYDNLEVGFETNNNNYYNYNKEEEENINGVVWKANELRKLVPGGEAMDMCKLLDETAHYIKCLATQVKLMRRIADFASA